MKISSFKSTRGSALVIALVVSGLMGLVLAACLTLVGSRNRITMRSLAWNSAIPVAEAGIEEAFSHLNRNSNNLYNLWTVVTVNGRTLYQKQRNFDDGSYFITVISNAPSAPAIYSQGFVPAPLGQGYISRRVLVTTTMPGEFSKAIQTISPITLNPRAPIVIDSFNSALGPYGGSNQFANASVGTDSIANPAISLGTTRVRGPLATGPGGKVDTSKGGIAGDMNWAGPGIQDGYLTDDMNVAFPNQSLPSPWSPFSFSLPNAQASPYGGTNYNYNLIGGSTPVQYQTGTINIGVGKRVVVTTGKVELYVNGDFTTGGDGYVYVAPGASLTIYAGGKATISGNGIANGTGVAANLSIKGLPTCTTVVISGNGDYTGTFNCPQAAMTISGNGGMYGAVIAKTFTITGEGSVHYDESLGGNGILTLSSYREL